MVALFLVVIGLENSRNDLTCSCIGTKCSYEAKHCRPTVKLFCFRRHSNLEIWNEYKEYFRPLWVFAPSLWLLDLILLISKAYLIIEAICAECNLFSCSLFLAKCLFRCMELELTFELRFNSDWCIAFLLAFCLSNRIFNSVELEWLGLEEKNNSALCSEFFLQIFFLIKTSWFITFLSKGNPVPCCPNMHFREGKRTYYNCSGWYRFPWIAKRQIVTKMY